MNQLKPCPYCEFPMEADWVDVGVGFIQCGPYTCGECGASEIGPEKENIEYLGEGEFRTTDNIDNLGLDEDEMKTGFYKNRLSPLANQHNGKVITHKQADAIYRKEYFEEHGNPYNAPIFR